MSSKEKFLGEFEQMVLLSLLQLGNDAYGAKIRQLLDDKVKRVVAIGALYSTLERLEKKSLVTSVLGDTTPERGGRAKRYFTVTAEGQKALIKAKNAMDEMWQGVSVIDINLKQFV